MSGLGIKLTFSDPEASAAFARELKGMDLGEADFRVAAFEPKLNMDAETMILVLKFGGAAATAISGFLTLSQSILKKLEKPSVKMEIEGKRVELFAKASDDDIRALCNILLRAEK